MFRINLNKSLALPFLFIVLISVLTIPCITSSQDRHFSEGWIQGHVTSLGRDSISVDSTRYQFDILVSIKDSDGNVLEPVALRNAEIVRILDRNGKALKIIIIKFRQ